MNFFCVLKVDLFLIPLLFLVCNNRSKSCNVILLTVPCLFFSTPITNNSCTTFNKSPLTNIKSYILVCKWVTSSPSCSSSSSSSALLSTPGRWNEVVLSGEGMLFLAEGPSGPILAPRSLRTTVDWATNRGHTFLVKSVLPFLGTTLSLGLKTCSCLPTRWKYLLPVPNKCHL